MENVYNGQNINNTKATELRELIKNLTQLRDRANADGNLDVAEMTIDAAQALMQELDSLYR